MSRASWLSSNGKVHESIYFRESYRQGPHVRKRNIANLTPCDPQEVAAFELTLQCKGNLTALASLDQIQLSQGRPVGAVWTVSETARRLGIPKALDIGLRHALPHTEMPAVPRKKAARTP